MDRPKRQHCTMDANEQVVIRYNNPMQQSDKTMYEFISEVRTKFGVTIERLDTLITHAKETNGRVHKLEIAYNKLEDEVKERDAMLEKMILRKEGEIKVWALKAIIGVTLFGSFLWIKESRDVVLSILKQVI
jgi:uncharacterized protein YpuA (DUF1002 family)